MQFWAAIHSYQNGTSSYPYRLWATYALACLSTPVSNALVERVFSHVNAIKTDKRNTMGLKMIESATRIRTTLMKKDKCCKDLVVTKDMLQKFTSNMYQINNSFSCGLNYSNNCWVYAVALIFYFILEK